MSLIVVTMNIVVMIEYHCYDCLKIQLYAMLDNVGPLSVRCHILKTELDRPMVC